MKKRAMVLTVVLTLSAFSASVGAQEKDKKEESGKQPAIRVCVAQIRNLARRSVSLPLQRDHLMKELSRNKPSKKAADQRRIEAVAIAGETPGGVDTAPRDQRCDFTLYVTLAELRDVADFKTRRESIEDLTRPPAELTGSEKELQTIARVEFALLRSGNLKPIVQSSVSAQENMPEEPTVQQLLDRVAQRVGSAVREKPEVMRE
ncbi:MAG: hypothetical protein M3P27_07480 [Acidobacteriota bacterium]|nr:hypothetical protein [Acidobacteriota bacterium]